MKKSFSVLLALATFLLGGVVASALTSTAWSQGSPRATASFARYQLLVPDTNSQYLLDTATGRVWYRFGTGDKSVWTEQGPDVAKPPRAGRSGELN